MKKNILFVLSNVSETKNGYKTGIWLDEFAVPYMKLQKEGHDITIASPEGGMVMVDAASIPENPDPEKDFVCDVLENTEKLSDVDFELYDAVVVAGGHAAMFDLADNIDVVKLIGLCFYENKIIAAICHGVAALLSAKTKENRPIVEGKDVTGFSNAEEKLSKTEDLMPFLLESRLKEEGAVYSCGKPFTSYVIEDENLITAQNPQSSEDFAKSILEKLRENED